MKYLVSSLKLILISAGMIAALMMFFSLVFFARLPSQREIRGCMVTKMYGVPMCPNSGDYVKISEVPAHLKSALLLSEDAGFYSHHGFDFQEMQNSFEKNIKLGKFARGGSTITQQLVKNMFLSKEKTLSRKIFEAIITLKMERTLSKSEILERYLNVVQFGKDVFGVRAAARHYFKKSTSDLSVLESAFLVFLLPSPEVYSKSFYKKQLTPFAEKRLDQILDKMYHTGKITEEQYQTAQMSLSGFLTGEEPMPANLFEALPDEESAPLPTD